MAEASTAGIATTVPPQPVPLPQLVPPPQVVQPQLIEPPKILDLNKVPQATSDFLLLKQLLAGYTIKANAKHVLEIGTDVGDSTRIFSSVVNCVGGKVTTVDVKPPHDKWVEKWEIKNVTAITKDSLALNWHEPIDLLFLDGDHAYDHVKQELETLGPWVKVGGWILCHDMWHHEYGPAVSKAVREFSREAFFPLVEYPHQDGLAALCVAHPLPK